MSEAFGSLGRYGRTGLSRAGETVRGGAQALGSRARSGARALGRSAQTGFARGQSAAGRSWHDHPLAMCAAALGAGVAVALLLPASGVEDRLPRPQGQTRRQSGSRGGGQCGAGRLGTLLPLPVLRGRAGVGASLPEMPPP